MPQSDRSGGAYRRGMQRTLVHRTLTIGLALATVACGSDGVETTPSPSANIATSSPEPAETPASMPGSAAPSASTSGGYPYPIGTVIQVLANSIRLRETPDTDAGIVGAMARDMTATVIGGPTESDGYTWFEVDGASGTGWVATGDSEDRWIVAAPDFERAELAFRFRYMCDVTPALVPPALTVTADRDVILTSGPDVGGWQIGRLTPEAFSDLMTVAEHPALQRSAEYSPELRADAGEPPGHGLCVYQFTFGGPDDRVHVSSVSWFGEEEEAAYYVPSPERRALDELARRLMLVRDLFADAAWEQLPTAYEADHFLVWILFEPDLPTPGAPSIDDLRVLGDPARFGEPISSGRCGYLDRAEVEQMATVFAGSPSPMTPSEVSYLTASAEGGSLTIIVSPIALDGFPTCGDPG